MQRLSALPVLILAAPALAHSGHLAEEAGHSHYLALGALGVALAIAVAGIVRGLRGHRSAVTE